MGIRKFLSFGYEIPEVKNEMKIIFMYEEGKERKKLVIEG